MRRAGAIAASARGGVATDDPALRDVLGQYPLAAMDPFDRPYLELAEFYARSGRDDTAAALIEAYEREVPPAMRPVFRFGSPSLRGEIVLARGEYERAIDVFRAADVGICVVCALPGLARAYDGAGQPDSAIAVYRRFVETPDPLRLLVDGLELAAAHKRLGELYETQGDTPRAVDHYNRFVELWAEADPELQPVVRDVRARIARMVGESTTGQ